MFNFIDNFHLYFILFTILISRINCRQTQLIQQISQCSNEEYYNVNLLKCIKCEQTFEHPPDQDYISFISSKAFNQGFSSNLVIGNQNISFNPHLAAASSSNNNLLQIQSNLERSSDGLSCVCKRGNFRFKKRNSKFVNELICLPCPAQMVSSLNRNTCSFCKKVPYSNEINNQFNGQNDQQTSKQVSNGECSPCGENEILVERLINSSELDNLNRTALYANYNYSYEFNLTHLDHLLTVQICMKCPSQTRSINNQCEICHFSFDNCECSTDKSLIVSNGVCIVKNQILKFNQEFFKINYTIEESNGLDEIQPEQSKENFKFSSYIAINFHSSFSQCYYFHNITACEQFSNLCVFNQYRYTFKTNSDLNSVCDLYMDLYVNKKMPANYLPQKMIQKMKVLKIIF